MKDLKTFEEFLHSLSEITGLGFEIRDADGRLSSAFAPRHTTPEPEGILELTRKIIETSTFQHASLPGAGACFGVPIPGAEEVIGVLLAYRAETTGRACQQQVSAEQGPSRQEMERLLSRTAWLIEENNRCRQDADDITEVLSQSFEDLHLFARIATQIKTLRFSDSMLRSLIEEIMESMGVDLAFAKFMDRDDRDVMVMEESLAHAIIDGQGLVDALVACTPLDTSDVTRHYFILNHSEEDPKFGSLYPDPYRFLAVRIEHESEFYGWLGLFSLNMAAIFRQSELRLLTSMAEQVAAVLANTDLYLDLERSIVNMVKSLIHAIEAKDVYTRGHSERVSEYCMRMATLLKLDAHQMETLQWASVLHDIGKIGISEGILNKPGTLTQEEYTHIQDHSRQGFNILRPLEQLKDSLPAILHHHERYDGTGYPDGLKGEGIPLLARIIAVADAYDAMTSHRAYRPAKPPEEALEILEEVAGSQLDPYMVELFVEMIEQEPGNCVTGSQKRMTG